jgi:predicted glutamine amidotransferase
LEPPESLSDQSHRNPDGADIGTFELDGTPELDKSPIAAYQDKSFVREAKTEESRTFVAHVRFASAGGVELNNTHPFEQRGRLMAHSGVVRDLPVLGESLGEHASLVAGDTDSESLFALITKETEARGGDVGAGIIAAVRWAAANLLVYALNLILTTETDMWALRYPDTNGLFVLEWAPDVTRERRRLNIAGSVGGVRVRFEDPAEAPAVVVASQRMDDNLRWRSLDPGELLHVDEKLNVTSTIAVDGPPARPLTRADLDPRAAASQSEDSRLPGEGARHRAGKAVRKAEAGNGP